MRYFLLALLFVLPGCASQIMKNYVGKSINEPILDYGQPANIMDMPDGTRAYQWAKGVTRATPGYLINNGSGSATTTIAGNVAYTNYSGTGNSAIIPPTYSNDTCFYTLFARREKGSKDWIVTGFRQPRLACE